MHKIFNNMLTDERHFREERGVFKKKEENRRGRKEERDGVRQACPTLTHPTV